MNCILVDNHGLFLNSLGELLRNENAQNHIFTYFPSELDELLDCLNNHSIDLVILDINMDGRDGFALGKEINKNFPEIPIAFLTGHGNQIHLQERAADFGAAGFFTKDLLPEDLIDQIQRAINGEFPGIVKEKKTKILTESEQEVLYYLSRGLRNGEIAEELHYSTRNVEKLKTRIFEKLEVKNEKAAIRKSFELGYDLIK